MNFLALLGWAPDGETTIMSRDELVERFSLERVGSSPATFDYAKLDWMNGVYLRALQPGAYADRLLESLGEHGFDWPEETRARGRSARPGEDRAARRVSGVRRLSLPRRRAGSVAARREDPRRGRTKLADTDPWTAEAIERTLKELCEELAEKPRTIYLPIRVAVTGSRV